MKTKAATVILTSMLLSACGAKPVIPYVEPDGVATAKLRIVTNGKISGVPYAGCLGDTQLMAKAGRFRRGSFSIDEPQTPPEPQNLQMPERRSPKLPNLEGFNRLSRGPYIEVSTEYRVPAGTPFMLESSGVSANHGSYSVSCKPDRKVIRFEEGKNYEAYIGLAYQTVDEKSIPRCVFAVYELVGFGTSGLTLPRAITAEEAADIKCAQ